MRDDLRSLNTLEDIKFAVRRIEELEAKLAKAVDLVKGMNDVMRQSGGNTWHESRSRKRLAELKGQNEL